MLNHKRIVRTVWIGLTMSLSLSLVVSCAAPPCANVCQDGQSACITGGKSAIVCALNAKSGCWSWTSRSCEGEKNLCQVLDGKAQCSQDSNIDKCKSACKVGSTQCSGNAVETCVVGANGACPLWSSPKPCATGQVCSNGFCTANPPTCQSTCTSGTTRCAANAVETCQQGQNQCWTWQNPTPCPAPKICQNGTCELSCKNVCQMGDKQCSGNSVQTCQKSTQGNCTLWGAGVACLSGQTCKNGTCQTGCQSTCQAGATRCSSGKLQACIKNALGCLAWSGAKACPSGQICQVNKCVVKCKNACTQGQTRCDGGSKQQDCIKDSQGCWKWGASKACISGQTCQGERCKTSGCKDACKVNTGRCYGNGKQLCQVGSNSCTEWGKTTSCPKGQVCSEGRCGVMNLTARTQQQICTRWKKDYPITTQPNFKNNGTQCDPGSITQGSINDAIRRLSLYRYLVGLPPTVEDPALSKINQSCAILQANNDGPGGGVNPHRPPKTWKCYTPTGAQGSGASNISWGVSNPAETIAQYMSDARVPSLGHRLWCISPGMGKTGIGLAKGTGRYRVASCLYTFARTSGPAVDYVAYPPPGWVPIQAMGSRHKVLDWSFNSSKYRVSSLKQVTLTRKSDNDVQTLTPRVISRYGQASGLSFRPRFPKAGEIYTVKMGSVFSYTVKFFDCR